MAKKKSIDELKGLSVPELNEKLVQARKGLFELKLKRSEQKDPLKIRWARREVARVLTLIGEKTVQQKSGGTIEKK